MSTFIDLTVASQGEEDPPILQAPLTGNKAGDVFILDGDTNANSTQNNNNLTNSRRTSEVTDLSRDDISSSSSSIDPIRCVSISSGICEVYPFCQDVDVCGYVERFLNIPGNDALSDAEVSETCLNRLLNGARVDIGDTLDIASSSSSSSTYSSSSSSSMTTPKHAVDINGESSSSSNAHPSEVSILTPAIAPHHTPRVPAPRTPLEEVLSVMPDAKVAYVESLLNEHDRNAAQVVDTMLERGYQKIEKSVAAVRKDIDFNSVSSFTPTAGYISNAEKQLANDFPYLGIKGLKSYLQSKSFHYYPTVMWLEQVTGMKAQCFPISITKTTSNGVNPAFQLLLLSSKQKNELKPKLLGTGLTIKTTLV